MRRRQALSQRLLQQVQDLQQAGRREEERMQQPPGRAAERGGGGEGMGLHNVMPGSARVGSKTTIVTKHKP